MMKNRQKTFRQRLTLALQKQAVKTQQNLSLILIGFFMSLLGIGLVMGGEFLVYNLLHRELLALAGVIIIATGCVLALVGYLSMSLLKIFYVITKDDEPPQK
ncbi:hypothetical protein A9R01_03910 ['Osedax' symbiont bacterium Rs2_46_30_T18]|nr:hypothetical protein A9R01_03910 ['Osedax' symbiont bacterium Rs2_46_30_T18]